MSDNFNIIHLASSIKLNNLIDSYPILSSNSILLSVIFVLSDKESFLSKGRLLCVMDNHTF